MTNGLFANWRFRSARPIFEPGTVIRAYLTEFDPATGLGKARIGDSILVVQGAAADLLDTLVDLRVEQFDTTQASGRAVLQR